MPCGSGSIVSSFPHSSPYYTLDNFNCEQKESHLCWEQYFRLYITSQMIETKSKKNAIVGYMGYMPNNGGELEEGIGGQIDSHVPGYVGYIPGVKSENLYAKTYGKITENCSKGNFNRGIEVPTEVKYKSTTKETYVNPNTIKDQDTAEGKISGVKATTFSNAAKWMIDTVSSKKEFNPPTVTSLTYEEACRQAYR